MTALMNEEALPASPEKALPSSSTVDISVNTSSPSSTSSSPSFASTDSAPPVPADPIQFPKIMSTEPASPETAASMSSDDDEEDDTGMAVMGEASPQDLPTHNFPLSTTDLLLSAPTSPMMMMDPQQQQHAPPPFPPPQPDPIPPPRSSMHDQVYEEAFTILDEVEDHIPVTSKTLSSSNDDFFVDEEDDEDAPQKSPLVSESKQSSWSLCRLPRSLKQAAIALGVVVVLFLIITFLFGEDGDSPNTIPAATNASATGTSSPTPNNPLTGDAETATYVVQWGIQTAGCSSLIWPTLELSCGNHANAAVHVLDTRISKPDTDDYTPFIDCMQKEGNLVLCDMRNYDLADSQGNDVLYGTVLATCVRKELADGAVPTFANGLELTANIPIGIYAQDCNQMLQNSTLDDAQTFHRHGGHSMPWMTVSRFCRSEERLSRRAASAELNMQMDVFMCGQGDHSEGDRLRQSYCYHQEDCATVQVCNSPETCAGGPSCDIPSGSIRSDTVDLATGGETDPKCIFDRVPHINDVWDAFVEQVHAAPPALDPKGAP